MFVKEETAMKDVTQLVKKYSKKLKKKYCKVNPNWLDNTSGNMETLNRGFQIEKNQTKGKQLKQTH